MISPSLKKKNGIVRKFAPRVLAALIIPALLLGMTEMALRVLDVGFPTSVTVPCTVGDKPAACDNMFFASKFFPPHMIRLPRPYAVPQGKSPQTFRIVVLGESAAFGDPEPSYGFSRYLEVMLRSQFPETHFEVINTGVTAINSHVVLPIAEDMAKRHTDLFIVYMGNNEVVGPFGPGTILTSRNLPLPLIRITIFLKSTRLGQLLNRALTPHGDGPQRWGGMEMFLGRQTRPDDPEMSAVYRNFRFNLTDIVSAARGSGSKVLLSTVVSNLQDCAPFASQHRKGLTASQLQSWNALVEQGERYETAANFNDALKTYEAAAGVDPEYAELQFRIGRVQMSLLNVVAAKKSFEAARDLDTLRFRADTKINNVIRGVAASFGDEVTLIDAVQALDEDSPFRIAGNNVLYEHVHFNPHGNYLIARSLFLKIASDGRLAPYAKNGVLEPLHEADCNRALALTQYDRVRVAREMLERLQRAPFTNQLNHEEEILAMSRDAEKPTETYEEIDAEYRWAIQQAPYDKLLHLNYAYFISDRFPAAANEELQLAQPYDGVPPMRYGR
jgi:tetratricopeptide (TPR) repeat protein